MKGYLVYQEIHYWFCNREAVLTDTLSHQLHVQRINTSGVINSSFKLNNKCLLFPYSRFVNDPLRMLHNYKNQNVLRTVYCFKNGCFWSSERYRKSSRCQWKKQLFRKACSHFSNRNIYKKSSKVEELIYKENCSFLMILNNTALIWMPCQISAWKCKPIFIPVSVSLYLLSLA